MSGANASPTIPPHDQSGNKQDDVKSGKIN
jgi:hypothetical protein